MMESQKKIFSSLQGFWMPMKSIKLSTSSSNDFQAGSPEKNLNDSPPINELEALRAKKNRMKKGEKGKTSKGYYLTMNPSIHHILFQTLHEQATNTIKTIHFFL